MAEETTFSERSKHRLRIAARLLRSEGLRFDVPRDAFYVHVYGHLMGMPEPDRERLRQLTDWVESYENALKPFDEQGE